MAKQLLNNSHVCEADENGSVGVAKHMRIDAASDGCGRDVMNYVAEVPNGKPAVCVHGLQEGCRRRKGVIVLSKKSKMQLNGGADGDGHVHETTAMGLG